MDTSATSDSFLGCLARRGRNAQHHHLPRRHHPAVISHRTCSAPQEAVRLVRTPHTPPPNALNNRSTRAPPPSKNLVAQVQPTAPPAKFRRGAPPIVQADSFFNRDSHPFNNADNVETHAECVLRRFLRNATRKMPPHSPHLLCCTLLSLCLVSGTLLRN
jgi:hypothetical protein